MKFSTGFIVGSALTLTAVIAFIAVTYESKSNKQRRLWDQQAVNARWTDNDWDVFDEWLAGS